MLDGLRTGLENIGSIMFLTFRFGFINISYVGTYMTRYVITMRAYRKRSDWAPRVDPENRCGSFARWRLQPDSHPDDAHGRASS